MKTITGIMVVFALLVGTSQAMAGRFTDYKAFSFDLLQPPSAHCRLPSQLPVVIHNDAYPFTVTAQRDSVVKNRYHFQVGNTYRVSAYLGAQSPVKFVPDVVTMRENGRVELMYACK